MELVQQNAREGAAAMQGLAIFAVLGVSVVLILGVWGLSLMAKVGTGAGNWLNAQAAAGAPRPISRSAPTPPGPTVGGASTVGGTSKAHGPAMAAWAKQLGISEVTLSQWLATGRVTIQD